MKFSTIPDIIRQEYARIRDVSSDHPIVVFESDDWGAIRVAGKDAYNSLMATGYAMEQRPYERYDTLESDHDVVNLADVLLSHIDTYGNPAQFTLNYLSGNPDFEKIRKESYERYHWESIERTYSSYPDSSRVIDLVKSGVTSSCFSIQYHGREHFNTSEWMRALRNGDSDCMVAFNHRMCGIFPRHNPSLGNQYMIALNCNDGSTEQIHREGIREFCRIWGKRPESFIAPCYTWDDITEKILVENGVTGIQSARFQRLPNSTKKIVHWMGERNNDQQIFTVRNCAFEPATSPAAGNEVAKCMREIDSALKRNAIAVICSHRINYVSGISQQNADRSIKMLDSLLSEILRKYPNVEFSTTDKLITKL